MSDVPPDPLDPSEIYPSWDDYSPAMQEFLRGVLAGRQDVSALRDMPSLAALSRAVNAINDSQQLRNVLFALMLDEYDDRDESWWTDD